MQLEVLPTQIDFRAHTETVDDQKAYGSCVAHAAQTALEIAHERANKKLDLSRMFLYYYVQKYAGTLGTVDGGFPKDIGPIIENHGCCLESTWKYDATTLGQPPKEDAYKEARDLFPTNTTKYTRITSLEQIKRKLAEGKPVILGFNVTSDFQFIVGFNKNWRTHAWNTKNPTIGYHAVAIIGYDETVKRLLVENSWSSTWGDGGFFGIPYDYITDRKISSEFYCFDKLNVEIKQEPDYIPESIPEFNQETAILEIPSIDFYPGNFASSTKHTKIIIKVTEAGDIKLNNELPTNLDRACFFFKSGDMSKWQLLMPKVVLNNQTYIGVVQTGARYEIISVG